jgi:hypothetical protein
VDPAALDDLLAAAPKAAQTSSEDGGTALGSDTGLPEGPASAAADAPPSPPSKPHVNIGTLTVQPEMSGPAVERAMRSQLYWGLVQRCRDKEGSILPPEVITLHFTIDGDGYIAAATILATPSDARYEEAAHCMRRALSTATFRAPAAARGVATAVNAQIPSVD